MKKSEMWAKLDRGERVRIDEELFDEYLEILPPRFMWSRVELVDGTTIVADFGFAEGDGVPVVAFWKGRGFEKGCFAQNTKLRTRG